MDHGIAIVGGNGSGKTTMGKQLAAALGYKSMDVEDYYFKASNIPYASPRTREEVQRLIFADIQRYGRFVLSAVNCDFGDEINCLYDCVIYIQAPLDIRISRVKKRSVDQFGGRVLEGGDMYEQEQRFYAMVASRTMEKTEAWLQSVKCPILYLDGTEPVANNLKRIQENLKKMLLI